MMEGSFRRGFLHLKVLYNVAKHLIVGFLNSVGKVKNRLGLSMRNLGLFAICVGKLPTPIVATRWNSILLLMMG